MVQNQVTSNHHIRGQPASNGHSQRNGHHGQHHHNSNGAHRHHRSHGHTHHHTHGAKRGKRNSGVTSGSSLKSECFYPVANMFSISLTPLHSSTPSAEMQSGSTFTASSAIVTIPPGNGKQSSKLGRRQRPLSHTAISAVPNNVGASSYSKSSPSVVSGANQGNVEQSPSKLQQFGQHDIVISGQQDAQPQHSDTHNPRRHNQMPSYPSTSSPSSSASSSSSSSSSSPTDSHLPNANSHKSLAPT